MWCPQHNQYCYEDTCPHGGPRPEAVAWKLPPYPATPTEREALAKRQAALGVPGTHPMRDGYAGSVLTSGKEGHALLVRYATREQADAAQAWLTDPLAGVDGVIHLHVEDAGLRQSLIDSLQQVAGAKEVNRG